MRRVGASPPICARDVSGLTARDGMRLTGYVFGPATTLPFERFVRALRDALIEWIGIVLVRFGSMIKVLREP